VEESFWDRLDRIASDSIPRKKLAEISGVSVSAISMWKSRNNYPTVKVAFEIAQAAGVSVEYLMTGQESDYWYPKNIEDIVKDLKIIDDEKEIASIKILTHAYAENRRARNREVGGG
jgi:transcriptional regulator with XRE-family HTH domain